MIAVIDRYIPWLAYPGTIALGILMYSGLAGIGQPVIISAYIPVFVAALLVTLLEMLYPNAVQWKPERFEVGQDTLYMVAVQMLLPRLLALGVALALIDGVGQGSALFSNGWPHHLPAGVQAIMMVLAADFLRYWLHRASHRIPWLWRLHAVHHSPQRLYWLNVGRFHPLEKTLQFLLDTLPFILLGVSESVVALYFVFYAINGFFQHSNIKLQYGLLNYVISSAELHRWHHSQIPEESNTNFGNNVIIWDLLFGTRFLPAGRTVGELGLKNRGYPGSFLDQLATPFTRDITDHEVPVKTPGRWLRRILLDVHMRWTRQFHWKPLARAARDPAAVQHALLMRLLHNAVATRFGSEHNFGNIHSYSDYAGNVPVQDYESLRPYIEAQENGEQAALTLDAPVMYAVTSGTTGEPKYIPVLDSTIRQYHEGQQLFSLMLYEACPEAFEGRVFGVASPAIEGYRPSGMPYGSVSGQLYASMPRLVQARYVIPPEVNAIADHALKYRVMLRLALAEPDISYFAGANPSSFLKLLAVLNESRTAFVDSLMRGGMRGLGDLDPKLSRLLGGRLKACPQRAELLRQIPPETEITYDMLWPGLRLVTVWTGGSCGVALDAMRKVLPRGVRVIDLGFLASELRVTVTCDPETGAGLPMLGQHFYEFAERNSWEAGNRQCLRLHELEAGSEYYLIVSTGSGLYRYFMNDIVRVVGKFHATPTLCFVQKGRGVTSITGEKVSEHQVLEAVTSVLSRNAVNPVFIMALADAAAGRYEVYIEPDSAAVLQLADLAAAVDASLCRLNIEYAAKRSSGRLASLSLNWLVAGANDSYRQYCVSRGQREGQFKPLSLQLSSEFSFPIDEYVQRNG